MKGTAREPESSALEPLRFEHGEFRKKKPLGRACVVVPCRILSSVQLALHKFRLHVKRVCGLAQGLGLILLNFSTPTPGSLKAVHDPESEPDSSGGRRRLLGPVPTVAQWVWDVGYTRGSQRRALTWIMLGKYHGRIFRNEFEDLGYSQGSLCDPSKHLFGSA